MREKGFTLIELLAVIVILAIIALIAVPIILGIIKDAKKESAKISAQNYFDAVELAISREYVRNPNANLDGTYTISNGGKKLTKDKIILTVEYEGNSQLVIKEEESSITVEKGKIVSVGNIRVGDLYVTADSGKITISDKLPTSELVDGKKFNEKIKKLSGSYENEWSSDNKIKSIEFLSNGSFPEKDNVIDFNSFESVDLSSNEKKEIIAYYDGNETIYIYSKNLISFNVNCDSMFSGFSVVTNINFGQVDTSNVENMRVMFSGCSSLTDLNLSSFNTKNVTNMIGMFQMCPNLTDLNIDGFNTSKVENMSYMFWNSSNLNKNDYYLKFDTSSVTDMSGMFSDYSSSTPLDLSKLETNSVTNMSSMFSSYSSSVALDLSKLNTSSVIDMSGMFSYYSSSTPLDLSKLETNSVTNMSNMFSSYSSSAPLDLSKLNTSKVENMSWMFCYYSSPTELDVSSLDISNVTDMSYMFGWYSSTSPLNLTSFNTSNVTNMSYMFGWIENPITVTVNKNTWITDNANTEGIFDGSEAQLIYSE